MNIINIVNKNPLFAQWQQQLKEGTPRQLLTGLSGSAKTLAIAGAYRQLDQPILVVTANLFYAYQLAEDLRNIEEEVYVFPVNEVISAEMAFSSPEAKAERIATLNAIAAGKHGIYIIPVSYIHLRDHETLRYIVFRLLLDHKHSMNSNDFCIHN